MLFSCGGCTQEFNTFLTALKGGVLNLFGTNKTAAAKKKEYRSIISNPGLLGIELFGL
jgi:hypothetical protein